MAKHLPKPKKPSTVSKKQAGQITQGSNALIDRYGYVHRIIYSPDAKSQADLIREAKQWLVGVSKPHATTTITHPGIPRIKRGDAMRVVMPGMEKGVRIGGTVVRDWWVTEAHFSLQPGGFNMELLLSTEDPFVGDPVVDKLTDTAVNNGYVPPTPAKKGKQPTKKNPTYKHSNEPSSKSGGSGDPVPPSIIPGAKP